jgi:hypothetical protein
MIGIGERAFDSIDFSGVANGLAAADSLQKQQKQRETAK